MEIPPDDSSTATGNHGPHSTLCAQHGGPHGPDLGSAGARKVDGGGGWQWMAVDGSGCMQRRGGVAVDHDGTKLNAYLHGPIT